MKAIVRVLPPQKRVTQKGTPYFVNIVELSQDSVATVSSEYRTYDESKSLVAGNYEVDLKIYARTYKNSKGYNDNVNVVMFSNYKKVD